MTPIPEPDYTVKETMQRLNTSRQTVYDLIETGQLTSYLIKKSRRITADSLNRLRGETAA